MRTPAPPSQRGRRSIRLLAAWQGGYPDLSSEREHEAPVIGLRHDVFVVRAARHLTETSTTATDLRATSQEEEMTDRGERMSPG